MIGLVLSHKIKEMGAGTTKISASSTTGGVVHLASIASLIINVRYAVNLAMGHTIAIRPVVWHAKNGFLTEKLVNHDGLIGQNTMILTRIDKVDILIKTIVIVKTKGSITKKTNLSQAYIQVSNFAVIPIILTYVLF